MKARIHWLCVAALAALSGCGGRGRESGAGGESGPLRRLNVVLVTIDTLRADRLGCYGYTRIETPNLDAVARRGALLEKAVCQAPLTAPSHASMMTGLNPNVHQVRDTGGFVLSPAHTTLAMILQRQGWDTAGFVGSSVLKKRFGFGHGFAVYDDEMGRAGASQMAEQAERRAGEVVDRAIQWLEARSGKPFFLWVHVFDPHLPYDPPGRFRQKYAGRPYDGEVAYTDQELWRLLEAVGKKSAPEKTLLAVLSDHGESFGEHGEYAHGVFLYETTLRIAFLMAGPGVPAGVRVKSQARTIDLLPTVLELMGGKAPAGVEGTSLVPAFAGKAVATDDSYAETLFPKINLGWAELRGIRTNRWKYVHAPKPELYDLERDPGETANVLASHPGEAQELRSKLEAMIRGAGGAERIRTTAADPRTVQQLKSLGYLSGGASREFELTGKGTDPKDRLEVLRRLHFAVYAEPLPPLSQRISLLRQAIAADPANPALYSHLGDVYAGAGRQGEALKLYEEAVKGGIQSAWLYARLGAWQLRQGNKGEAIKFFERAEQLDPSDYASLQNLAVAYRETGRIADAERVCNRILESGEEYAPAYNELGMVWFQKGDLTRARGYFEKAAQLDATYQLNLGRLYKMLGENERARASFEAFLAARGASAEYRQLVPEVKRELANIR